MAQATQLMDTANITPPEPISDTEVEQAITTDALYTFSILFQDTATLTNIATDIRNQWQQLGFDVSVESVSEDVLYERLATGDFQAAVVTLPIGSDPDVYRYWHAGQAGNAQNYGRVNNNEVAELLESARGDNNGLNRTMVYEQFQERFAEQAIAIPLYYPLYTLVTRNHIEGVKLGFLGTSADRFRNIQDWRPASLAG
jgi:ABC-type transport system substrate-binding protein